MGPAKLKHEAMNQTQVEKAWRRDRISLVVCKNKNEAFLTFYRDLKARLSTPAS